MAISQLEIAFMRQLSVFDLGDSPGMFETIRGGEYWFFPADHTLDPGVQNNSASATEMEKRLAQSKRQHKDNTLNWLTVRFESGQTHGKGLLIQGLTRAQAIKFAYKLKLSSLLLYTATSSFVVATGYSIKKE